MLKLISGFLDWIYKKKCYFCGKSKESVKMCSTCFDSLDYQPFKINRIIDRKNVYCAGVYSKNLQKLIRGLKYHRQRDLAYYLAKFMYNYWQNLGINGSFQIVPVPIFPKREQKRKYNHMNLTAQEFSLLSGYNVNYELIKRVKDTKPQYKLKKVERAENLQNAFIVDKSKLQDGPVLLIDDICTTGSTFEEMINELNKNGINDIVCLSAATPFED